MLLDWDKEGCEVYIKKQPYRDQPVKNALRRFQLKSECRMITIIIKTSAYAVWLQCLQMCDGWLLASVCLPRENARFEITWRGGGGGGELVVSPLPDSSILQPDKQTMCRRTERKRNCGPTNYNTDDCASNHSRRQTGRSLAIYNICSAITRADSQMPTENRNYMHGENQVVPRWSPSFDLVT